MRLAPSSNFHCGISEQIADSGVPASTYIRPLKKHYPSWLWTTEPDVESMSGFYVII